MLKKLLNTVIVLLTVLLCGSMVAAESAREGDKALSARILGSWAEVGEGNVPYAISTFKEGGIYEAKIWQTPERKELIVSAAGKWWISHGKLYNTVHSVEPPILPTADEPIVDAIVEITAETMTLLDAEGRRYTSNRVN